MKNEKFVEQRRETCQKIDLLIQQYLEDANYDTCGLDKLFPILTEFFNSAKSLRNFLRKLKHNGEQHFLPSIEYFNNGDQDIPHWKWRCIKLPS